MSVEKIWRERQSDEAFAKSLSLDLNISFLLAKMLSGRFVDNLADAKEFLSPSLKNLTEPLLFKDMDKAIERIVKAVYRKEIIGIFGDYDVDGVCATAVLQQFLESIFAPVVATLPHRMTEGYGLSRAGIDRLKAQGASLLVTVDCGSLAYEEIAYAKDLGLEVIVLDHHNVSNELPMAYAVVNPKREDCEAKADFLCAAGVTFFLCMGVRRHLREADYFTSFPEPDLKDLLDLVALATVCDVVPLHKDNRILVKSGLSTIKQGKRAGLKALMSACSIEREKISSTNLGFHLGPRINAAGRLEDATSALKLLLMKTQSEANLVALELNAINLERRHLEEETVREACEKIEAQPNFKDLQALILHDEKWHPGVVGIVASRIAERYHRPSIIIGEKGKGSGRSIKGIDLHHILTKAKASLKAFGGHAHAVGVTLGPQGVLPFTADVLAAMNQLVSKEVFQKEILYDAEISLSEISLPLIEELSKLEPFGAKNPYPMVRINRCSFRNLRRFSGHSKAELEGKDGVLSCIGFRMDIEDEMAKHLVDVVGVLEINEWLGKKTAQLRLIDYKKAL